MNKVLSDAQSIEKNADEQRGVFSKSDLQTILAEKHAVTFARRVKVLEQHGVVRRFIRGWYVTERFDLPTLSQRLAPGSYISFGRVLAAHLLVGTTSEREIMAVKLGRTRTYEGLAYRVVHVGVTESLFFGFDTRDGLRTADVEKAVLDVLYFHLRGRRFAFDIYSDIRFDRLDQKRLTSYLAAYHNPKFVRFVENLVGRSAA